MKRMQVGKIISKQGRIKGEICKNESLRVWGA